MNKSLNDFFAIVAVCGSLAGCGSQGALRSQLDPRGQTWVSFDATVTLARPAPRFSNAARDYLYLAPVETSTNGTRRHYLWVALGTTVDRAWPWAAPPEAATLLLTLDGLPLALPLDAWSAPEGEALYSVPAPPYEVRRASVSLDELARIAAAGSIEASVVATDGGVASYELWDGRWADWQGFLAAVDPAGDFRDAEVLGNAR
jgi:hypothetical protein